MPWPPSPNTKPIEAILATDLKQICRPQEAWHTVVELRALITYGLNKSVALCRPMEGRLEKTFVWRAEGIQLLLFSLYLSFYVYKIKKKRKK
jgi:hypothetical protein